MSIRNEGNQCKITRNKIINNFATTLGDLKLFSNLQCTPFHSFFQVCSISTTFLNVWTSYYETHQKQVVSSKEIPQHQSVRRGGLAHAHQHGESTNGSIMFHWNKDWGQRHVHATFHEPSFIFW
jgi:hypothetical protein